MASPAVRGRECSARTRPATNQIDAIVAVEPGHGVDERQRFDGEAKSAELIAQRFEPCELVAQRRPRARTPADRSPPPSRSAACSIGPSSLPSRNARAIATRSSYCCTVQPPTHGPRHLRTSKRMQPGVRGNDVEQLGLIGEMHPLVERRSRAARARRSARARLRRRPARP